MSKARDEKIKLTANLLNTVAGSCITVGVLLPLISILLNLGNAQSLIPPLALMFVCPLALALAYGNHRYARNILEDLDK
jgi:hypothetical protein